MQNNGDKWFQLAMLAKEITNPRDFGGAELIGRALEEAGSLFPVAHTTAYPHHDPASAVGNFIDALHDALATSGFVERAQRRPDQVMTEADLAALNGEIPL